MRPGAILFAILLAVSATGLAEDNSYTLDFQKGHNLKLVYDAGLRPWKETNSTCMVGGNGMKDITHWKIILADGERFDYASNMADFEVMENFDVGRIDFSGVDDTPIQDAAAMTNAICKSLNIPNTGLNEMVAGLNPNAKFNEHPKAENGWQQRVKRGGVDFFISFVVRPFFDHTSAQINITMEWPNYPADDPTFSKGPLKHSIRDLQPPPGYEGVSMAPPQRNPNQKGFPEHDADYYKQKIDDYKKQLLAAGVLTAFDVQGAPVVPGDGTEYRAGNDYLPDMLPPGKVPTWKGSSSSVELQGMEVKVQRLLQADKELKTLRHIQTRTIKETKDQQLLMRLPGEMVRLNEGLQSLDVVLVMNYEETAKWLVTNPNPLLLKQMLCHYYLYVDSHDTDWPVSAHWPDVIGSLSKIDPAVTTEAVNEVKAYRDANQK